TGEDHRRSNQDGRQSLHSHEGAAVCRDVKVRFAAALIFTLAAQIPLQAKCPVSGPMTLVVRAPMGNLQIDTTGRDSVETQVSNSIIQIQETCGNDSVELTSNSPNANAVQGTVNWRILVPKNANLDLVTMAGSINI